MHRELGYTGSRPSQNYMLYQYVKVLLNKKFGLVGDLVTEDDLNSNNLYFFNNGAFGVNLLKLHGALNVCNCSPC